MPTLITIYYHFSYSYSLQEGVEPHVHIDDMNIYDYKDTNFTMIDVPLRTYTLK